jgi:hypothetical protein
MLFRGKFRRSPERPFAIGVGRIVMNVCPDNSDAIYDIKVTCNSGRLWECAAIGAFPKPVFVLTIAAPFEAFVIDAQRQVQQTEIRLLIFWLPARVTLHGHIFSIWSRCGRRKQPL